MTAVLHSGASPISDSGWNGGRKWNAQNGAVRVSISSAVGTLESLRHQLEAAMDRLDARHAGRRPWAWAARSWVRHWATGPTWCGYEAEMFGGRRIEGFGLLTEDGRECWLNSERRHA